MRHSQFSICENDTSFFKPKAIGFAVAHPLEFADNSQKCVSDHFCKTIIMKPIVHIGHFICMAKTIKKKNYKYKEGRLNQIVSSTSIIMLFEFFMPKT